MNFPIKALMLPILLTAGVTLTGCDELKPGRVEIKRDIITGVEVSEAVKTPVPVYFEATGTVKAVTVSSLLARTMGTVTSINVTEGDPVERGQLLLTMDSRDARARLEAAEAGLIGAKKTLKSAREQRDLMDKTYERYKVLYDEKAISAQEFDEIATKKKTTSLELERAEEAVSGAGASAREARTYLDFTRVTSPVKGVVTAKHIDTGSMATPGVPLLTVEDTSSYLLELQADEGFTGLLNKGARADVILDSINVRTQGEITEISPAVNPSSRTFLVKVSVKEPSLRTGLFARVSIPVGERELLLVPTSSVITRGGLTGVYTVNPKGIVTMRPVRLGAERDGKVEVLSGLASGERIISAGIERAFDGGQVTGLK